MLFRDKSTSLTINYTRVFPVVFLAFFYNTGMYWRTLYFIDFANETSFCLWIMALHAHKTDFASAEQSTVDDNGGLKCEANMIVW